MFIHTAGFSLIEVLISLVLLSFLLLALAVTEVSSLKQAQSAYLFNVSVNQLMNMSEKLIMLQQCQQTGETGCVKEKNHME